MKVIKMNNKELDEALFEVIPNPSITEPGRPASVIFSADVGATNRRGATDKYTALLNSTSGKDAHETIDPDVLATIKGYSGYTAGYTLRPLTRALTGSDICLSKTDRSVRRDINNSMNRGKASSKLSFTDKEV